MFLELARASSKRSALAKLIVPAVLLILLDQVSVDGLSRPGDLSRIIPEFYAGVLLHTLRNQVTSIPRISGALGLV